ncbi:MAG: HD domain-containing protein [Eubacteriales bacterium]
MDVWDTSCRSSTSRAAWRSDRIHHRYDVLEHSFRVCRSAADGELRLAALLRDVGKPDCPPRNGRAKYDHDKYGERIAKRVLNDLLSKAQSSSVANALVGRHMYDIQRQAKTDTLRVRFCKMGRERTLEQILLCGSRTSAAAATIRTMWRRAGAPLRNHGATARHFPNRELAITGEQLQSRVRPAGRAESSVR